MPRRKASPPAYCHHKASGRAYVKADGRRRYLGKYDTPESREAYQRFLAAHWKPGVSADSPAVLPPVDPQELTIVELIDRYWACALLAGCRRRYGPPAAPDWNAAGRSDDLAAVRRGP